MKQCHFCNNGVKYIDHKDLETLKKFLNPYARIINQRITGVCARHQRQLAESVKRARFLALLPYVTQ